ncbi:MAG: trehalose-phosphatase [Actinobacteria bacterium 13_1_20CM_2_65_11]|nr:MAG: trehalose-phosphatase [Chloroflexi bacterium 13_1_40CM_65_17]OLC64542.1 MAG: trehalose-phosphatase [Actinobacteria bacterium 13_1_40CM_4_65_12]OLD25482.1 MAG: trehalose-phosphatase [Chloroflexi bacterium 13_1_40CM_3_65_12]OLE80674.1 MAG: trehalose-phosphatase [Actinobacteria bacterium 13_1_20CM_2_65_11]
MVRVQLEEIAEVWRRSPVSAVLPKDLMLVTDFDGTLAEIGPDPARSAAQPEALDALRRLSRLLNQVVVLSSRTPTELERLVPVSGVRLIGDSGLAPPTPDEKRALERFNTEAARILGTIPGAWIEIKPASTTVHLRNARTTPEEAMALLRPLVKATGLYGAQGRKVIEVHTRFAGKGTALTKLLDEVEPGGVMGMGDDENDRSAFEVLSACDIPHLCIGISSPEVPPDLFARCDLVLDGPRQATTFLEMLADWAAGMAAN